MLTTFARLAKVIKGLVSPANWIEDAFADIGGGGGGGGGALAIHVDENGTLDKTWQEIKDASETSYVYLLNHSTGRVEIWAIDGIAEIAYFPGSSTPEGTLPPTWSVQFIQSGPYQTLEGPNSYPTLV